MEINIANWKNLEAEIISADIQQTGLKYRVIVRYSYIEEQKRCIAEYASRELATESIARAYAEVVLELACP